jgi:hypothetical protein
LASKEHQIKNAQALLGEISIEPRTFTGPGKRSQIEMEMLCGKIPKAVVTQFRGLSGAVSHNMERALKLFLLLQGENKS